MAAPVRCIKEETFIFTLLQHCMLDSKCYNAIKGIQVVHSFIYFKTYESKMNHLDLNVDEKRAFLFSSAFSFLHSD